MHIRLIVALFAFTAAAQASSSLRVGSQVLAVGDSRERVTELLGKPSSKSHKRSSHGHNDGSGGSRRGSVRVQTKDKGGEQWRYRRDDHVTVVTLVDGRVSDIEDERI